VLPPLAPVSAGAGGACAGRALPGGLGVPASAAARSLRLGARPNASPKHKGAQFFAMGAFGLTPAG
ncbi:MAG TPA: hypothetical protein VF881_20380, partial [Polyangiaceae bacterium]